MKPQPKKVKGRESLAAWVAGVQFALRLRHMFFYRNGRRRGEWAGWSGEGLDVVINEGALAPRKAPCRRLDAGTPRPSHMNRTTRKQLRKALRWAK